MKLHEKFVSGRHPIDSDDKIGSAVLAPTVEQAVMNESATAEFQLQQNFMLRNLDVRGSPWVDDPLVNAVGAGAQAPRRCRGA